MSLPELTMGIFNEYTPSGAFSIEFRDNSNNKIVESFFARPPTTYSVTEKQRSVLQKTLYGGFIGDNGNDFINFSVSGSLWFHALMSESNPLSLSPDETFHDGLSEFFKLRFMVMRYRSYTMTKNSNLVTPSFSRRGLESALALKSAVNSRLDSSLGALSDQIKVVWHSYDYDDHYLARVDSFGYDIDANKDVFTVNYKIDFEAYSVDTLNSGNVQTGIIRNTPEEEIESIDAQLRTIGLDTLPSDISGVAA